MLQVIERATGGWGVHLHFFQVAYILAGPWYLTWLTSFVVLAVLFVYGMWYGLVYRRWNLLGLWPSVARSSRGRRRTDHPPLPTPGRPSAASSPPSARPG